MKSLRTRFTESGSCNTVQAIQDLTLLEIHIFLNKYIALS